MSTQVLVSSRLETLDLDLDDNRQSPMDITATKWMCTINIVSIDVGKADSWLLNDDTEAADVMTSGKEFH